MKIFLREIPAKGLEIDRDILPDEIGLAADGLNITAPLAVKGNIRRVEDTAFVHVEVKTRCRFLCARCLEPVEKDISIKNDFDYLIEKGTEFFDVGEDIRQETILHLASRTLCSKDCKGICPGCGVNLNKEKCRCQVKA